MSPLRWLACLMLATSAFCSLAARAQSTATTLELTFVPTDRAQIAVWIERDDGLFIQTLALTHAVSRAGIGNRPGALQMNSGYRWPYGRREGVLPVWAHRRAQAPGAKPFKRVIFQNRRSEGFASRTVSDQSADEYYCLSFQESSSSRDELDAVTCPSIFSSDKGRFFIESTDEGYSEPFESPDFPDHLRELGPTSLYPPRRDVDRCTASGCYDHQDVAHFKAHALEVMPELDAITRATPQGRRRVTWDFVLPEDLDRSRAYTLFLEVNVEGDYNNHFNPERYPTPALPKDRWDSWAMTYGYPYRGQPSVVFALPFVLEDDTFERALEPVGYGDLHGLSGTLHPIDASIANDPMGAPGSGADRLLVIQNARVSLHVARCNPDQDGLLPGPVQDLRVEPHPDRQLAHVRARLSFKTPDSPVPVTQYEVRVKPEGGDWEQAFTPDADQDLLPVALDVCAPVDGSMGNRCTNLPPGSPLAVDLAGLRQATGYTVSVTPRAGGCGGSGPAREASFATPERSFATVSPCFIASVAYGSPLAPEIGALRRFRDRYLASHALGRWAISAYYRVGPELAERLRTRPWLRSLTRKLLEPVVSLVGWWLS